MEKTCSVKLEYLSKLFLWSILPFTQDQSIKGQENRVRKVNSSLQKSFSGQIFIQ